MNRLRLRYIINCQKLWRYLFIRKKQETIAGTDGLDTFRNVFRNRTKLNVVLFRAGWGSTPWTRIEETAITERCLAEGWNTLLFIVLNKKEEMPKWLPETNIRLNYEDYGFEQSLGVIKTRVQERGGKIHKPSMIEKAKSIEKAKIFYEEKPNRFFSDGPVVNKMLQDMFDNVIRKFDEINATTTNKYTARKDSKICCVVNEKASVCISWHQPAFNSLNNSFIIVDLFVGRILLPGEHGYYLIQEPKKVTSNRFIVDLHIDHGWCWVNTNEPEKYYDAQELVENMISSYLSIIEKVVKGEIRIPTIFDN